MSDEQQIIELFEDGDRALISADVAELRRIYADDYVQYDESGKASTRQDLIDRLTSGKVRFVSMISTGRQIRLLRNDVAVVHGSEEDEVEQDGQRSSVRYVYLDVVIKKEDRWQILASQLARPTGPRPLAPGL
ncbi:MAG TPA: nuclear transport factor 2 family protein [Candidatus Sulfotelmatobacter sp.]|nr:nuclear transport factor 2 family protein [Candidatus Sulfotelmatobacter sp.]